MYIGTYLSGKLKAEPARFPFDKCNKLYNNSVVFEVPIRVHVFINLITQRNTIIAAHEYNMVQFFIKSYIIQKKYDHFVVDVCVILILNVMLNYTQTI